MPGLIVIRVVPESSIDANTFTSYLSALGGLQITAFDLSFNDPSSGQNVGTASYVAPTALPTPTAPVPLPAPPPVEAQYPAGITNGVIQQYDLEPPTLFDSGYFQLESVATAVIQVAAPSALENLRLVVTWGSGAGARPLPVTLDYYDVALVPGPSPADPNQWAALAPSLFLSIPAPPTATGVSLTLPADGTPPPFDTLLTAVQQALNLDPGGAPPNLGALTPDQCRNMAYEIVWSQQPALPVPPDPVEDLYTNPPNSGTLLSGGTPYEADRQQFEAQLKSYYALADATADRLTNYLFALVAAVACEELSLAANEAMLEFPIQPGTITSAPVSHAEVILNFANVGPPANFGVPAAYFYALGATLPSQITPAQRYQLATGDAMDRLLSEMTTALNAGTVTDAEKFTTLPAAVPPISAARAVRRLTALEIPAGSTTPLAPLGTLTLLTSADTPAGSTLPFSSTEAVSPGMSVSGADIPAGTTVTAVAAGAVTLSQPSAADVPAGTAILFAPPYPADLQQLVQAWLAFPPPVTGQWSSQAYQPSDDDAQFWPTAATNHPTGFLNLVLCCLTQGFIIPAPVNASLGDQIIAWLTSAARVTPPPPPPATVAMLASATVQQWTALFTAHPTWLPPFTGPGDTAARIAAFIRFAQRLFAIVPGGPAASINLATSTNTTGGAVLPFASTNGVAVGMSASGLDIPAGTLVAAVTPASVTLSQPITGPIPAGTNILFTPNYVTTATSTLPLLDAPSTDWLAACLAAYGGTITFGTTVFNIADLKAAAATVFPGDPSAQDWVVDALLTIDNLYRVIKAVPLPPPVTNAAAFRFSLVEALYARGFKSARDMTELPAADFQEALTGTIAYDLAGAIWAAAAAIAPPPPPPPSPGGFHPVNDGSLKDCIPPECMSPLGAISYLSEMLQVGADSTCEHPLNPAAATTLAAALAQRRGPLANLAASCANLETPLPLIDIVNECLEYMGASVSPTGGTVYNSSPDTLAGHVLCKDDCADRKAAHECHRPATIFGALPEYSTPATPVTADAAVEPLVYNKLKIDFSTCCLPYSQALDVSRTYLRHFRSCRFEEMRTFRKCITEFVLDPVNEPTGFQSHLWRYPVRIDIAIEYLGITPEEYRLLFQGNSAPPCGKPVISNQPLGDAPPLWQLYGFPNSGDNHPWTAVVVRLPEFLRRTCLTYCEFLALWKCGFVVFRNGGQNDGAFPDCEPCCLENLWLQFPVSPGIQLALLQLIIFIRLWRKLKDVCGARYSFDRLRDICDVLHLFDGGAINPDFIRQLAAFQIFRDHFGLPIEDAAERPGPGAIGADRTELLALWTGTAAAKWHWAVRQMMERIEYYARCHHKCESRSPEFLKILIANLDPLSRLAGFDPANSSDTWHHLPTHTLRFAEVLAKIYASDFTAGEILYLFTAGEHLEGDDPFPLQEENESLDLPFHLPGDQQEESLWCLRRKLLEVSISDEEVHGWSWKRIEAALRDEFGFAPSDILALGEHFFPDIVAHAGYQGSASARCFFSNLPLASTIPQMWNTPPEGPFQYDPTSERLWAEIPLTDERAIEKLTHVRTLNPAERQAVQDLYFQPRAMLAGFALLFADFRVAEARLTEEGEERERWEYFRRQFVLCHRRCHIIAEHLADHVAHVTGQKRPEAGHAAMLILRELFADENLATANWENDAGTTPTVTWTPPPNGGAFAALLGLTGTGLLAEYRPAGGAPVWREVTGPLSLFGREKDRENCPVPTVLPALDLTLTPQQLQVISVRNGFAVKDSTGAWLGGAQAFEVTCSGALLVDREGSYEFWAGSPRPEGEEPDWEGSEHRKWRVVLRRGQRTWILLSHDWPGEHEHRHGSLPLKRGVYELKIEFLQPAPDFLSDEPARRQHTGFQLKYSGPDSDGKRVEIPQARLFVLLKNATLGDHITAESAGATAFLSRHFVSTLRDIRRTYQRAFKALLFTHRFEFSVKQLSDRHSELSYMLEQKMNFAGAAYYRSAGAFQQHLAGFDFNFLPLLDNFHSPAGDSRTQPSPQRAQAMFDWWERVFDYCRVRDDVRRRWERHVWLLFDEALEKQPVHAAFLLRHMGADSRHWEIDIRYCQDQGSPVYQLTYADLEDDRWVMRAWHADQWIRTLLHCFNGKDIRKARPDLWASEDPSAPIPGEVETGNANLLAFLCDGCFENGEPRRYEDVRRLNDGLRERGRDALLAWLCAMNRVPLPMLPGQFATEPRQISDILLLDVETGVCEKASRIEEAITAVQNFILRARLHLEPGWDISHEFSRMWDRRFLTLHIWKACKRREFYKENFIEWDEVEKARRVEAFRFLESELPRSALTIAVPGGLEWWPSDRPPAHPGIEMLQKSQASSIRLLPAPREGLNLLGTPERDARPSWLAAVQASSSQVGGNAAGAEAVSTASGGERKIPFWMEAAIRLGTRFYRIAAAGTPPAASGFEPHKRPPGEGECVECCRECGCPHPARVDEYYFWLIDGGIYTPPAPSSAIPTTAPDDYQQGYQDDYYDPSQQQSVFWQDPSQLPQLLEWPPSFTVRLAWCRVHNGEFQQPRRSVQGVLVTDFRTADLVFQGRSDDSLTFSVTNPAPPSPQPGYLDPSAPGFRYDLARDSSVVLPLVTLPPASGGPYLGTLPAYPFFVYVSPGKHLFPLSPFAPALAVAWALRSHCRFEAALRWYRLAFDPLSRDCTWIHCEKQSPPPSVTGAQLNAAHPASVASPPGTGEGCCDSTDITCAQARHRAIVLLYLETLQEWGQAAMRRNTPEAFQHARLIFDAARHILGDVPPKIELPPPATPPTVGNFQPYFAPLNPRLLDLYENVRDRLALLHACLNSRRLRSGKPDCDMPYFGDSPLREGWRTAGESCAEEAEWCHPHSPYRFLFLIQKAEELAGRVREFGAELLSAFEKGDAEYLAALRATHERELATLQLESRKDEWRDADWQIEALQKTKEISQTNLKYFNALIQQDLIDNEIEYKNETITATILRGLGNTSETIAEAVGAAPNEFSGTAGIGGSPLDYFQLPVGTSLAGVFATAARIMNGLAEIANSIAGLDLTEANWTRRSDEWVHQTDVLTIEIQQIERQILAAQRRRDQALQELNSNRRQVEQAVEVQNFLRDRFTAHDLYLFLQKETAALHDRLYELALGTARQAEHAFNFERGHTTRRFVAADCCDTLHERLTAGARLEVALRRMEKAYQDENVREYELTRHFSLRVHFPIEYLRLRVTGRCEFEIPEWMFDLDYPGMYLRRIRNVTLTIPCVTGPYNGIHCRLTLLSSMTRIDPRLSPPPHRCCCEHRSRDGYDVCPEDPRIVRQYAAREAIATSSGRNDSGMFELNFKDERYLPFEYLGAVSRWRVELPRENNFFEMDTVSDLILHLNYTAREGGELLRKEANRAAQTRLPGDGWTFFDVRRDFPDAWELFRHVPADQKHNRCPVLRMRLDRGMFPFLPDDRDVWVDKIALLFTAGEPDEAKCREIDPCACRERKKADRHEITFAARSRHDTDDHERFPFPCVAHEEWSGLYRGLLSTRLGPLGSDRHSEAIFEFPAQAVEVSQVYMFCHYTRSMGCHPGRSLLPHGEIDAGERTFPR